MNIISDYISISVLLFNIYALFELLFGNLEFILGIFTTLFIEHYIKDFTQDYIYFEILKRPDGAFNCCLFNDGGLVDHKSGFPSGHMSVTSFFSHLYYFKYSNNYNWKNYFIYNFINLFMAYARYSKKCHNFFQIFGGYLLGYFISLNFYHLHKFIFQPKKLTQSSNLIHL